MEKLIIPIFIIINTIIYETAYKTSKWFYTSNRVLIYLITDFISIQLIISVLKNKKNKTEREEKLLTEDRKLITQILPLIIFSVSILLEYFLPNLTIIFFIIFPVTMSLVRAFKD